MTKEQKRIKSEELSKNQEKIIQIWKSGDKTLALILGRTIMNDRKLLNFCFDNINIFSSVSASRNNWRILILHVSSIRLSIDSETIMYNNNTTCRSTSITRTFKSEYDSFRRFLNHVCGNKRIKK